MLYPLFYWGRFELSSGYWEQMKTHYYLLPYA